MELIKTDYVTLIKCQNINGRDIIINIDNVTTIQPAPSNPKFTEISFIDCTGCIITNTFKEFMEVLQQL